MMSPSAVSSFALISFTISSNTHLPSVWHLLQAIQSCTGPLPSQMYSVSIPCFFSWFVISVKARSVQPCLFGLPLTSSTLIFFLLGSARWYALSAWTFRISYIIYSFAISANKNIFAYLVHL